MPCFDPLYDKHLCYKQVDLQTSTSTHKDTFRPDLHNHHHIKKAFSTHHHNLSTHPHKTTTTKRKNQSFTPQKMGFMDSIRAKMELYRLEQRYARRDKRTTFTTGARYVDGEYIFESSSSPGSPTGSTGSWQHSVGSASSSSKRGTAVVKVKELMTRSVR